MREYPTDRVRETPLPAPPRGAPEPGAKAQRCRRKFLKAFPDGFRDDTYLAWERDYKWAAHKRWKAVLDRPAFEALLVAGKFHEIALAAVGVEAPTNLIFSYEKMALRDAIRSPEGARIFAEGLFSFLHGEGDRASRFTGWRDAVARLPRKQSRVLTWPVVTAFGFLADPRRHFFFKPTVTRRAAEAYGYDLAYGSRPSWEIYQGVLEFANAVARDLRDLKPRDMIDIQSFLWVQGSDEY
jgi:hypothetical protein